MKITVTQEEPRGGLVVVVEVQPRPIINTHGEPVEPAAGPGLAKADRKVVPLHETLRRVG